MIGSTHCKVSLKACDGRSIRAPLLKWFRSNARDLPWRRNRTPYAVWISEMMLQQTQAAAVVPFFNRFMKRLPSVQHLAAARLDTVLKLWEGLGYYARARNLHKTAVILVRDFKGQMPSAVDQLRELPGIGRYTAGAIASIAFNRPAPILDGNVTRVLCRLFAIDKPAHSPQVQKQLWDLAAALVQCPTPGDLNEALMELGAVVCTPRNPACPICPLKKTCLALRSNRCGELPIQKTASRLPHFTVVAGVVLTNGKVLIDKRKPDGLLGGLWEFPGGKKKKSESFAEAVKREVFEETGIEVTVGKRLCLVHHTYSHFRITLHVYLCRYESGTARPIDCAAVKWVDFHGLTQRAFPAANIRIIEKLRSILA
ncbi:MAG: A/G-specific adenine glycosylase [Planctomycetaceae bacterium]|nr:A/G-specific adenine glycosylase [Planctomycetaceae bacterium]